MPAPLCLRSGWVVQRRRHRQRGAFRAHDVRVEAGGAHEQEAVWRGRSSAGWPALRGGRAWRTELPQQRRAVRAAVGDLACCRNNVLHMHTLAIQTCATTCCTCTRLLFRPAQHDSLFLKIFQFSGFGSYQIKITILFVFFEWAGNFFCNGYYITNNL